MRPGGRMLRILIPYPEPDPCKRTTSAILTAALGLHYRTHHRYSRFWR